MSGYSSETGSPKLGVIYVYNRYVAIANTAVYCVCNSAGHAIIMTRAKPNRIDDNVSINIPYVLYLFIYIMLRETFTIRKWLEANMSWE